MSHVLIVGAGRVGLAVAKIIRNISDWDVSLLDTKASALTAADTALRHTNQHLLAGDISCYHIEDNDEMEEVILSVKPDVVVCTTPFQVNVKVACATFAAGCHYVDFTEDNGVTREIASLPITESTFVPQTGLAPGLVSYLGLELFEELGDPKSLDLRVGALPQVAFGPAHYAITWSPEGLVNEYIKPAFKKYDGVVEQVEPLTDLETLLVNGVIYEGFTTAGGVGDLSAYPHIPFVEYKTLRHPGHLQYIKDHIIYGSDFTLEKGVDRARALFDTTRDDVVVLVAHAVDQKGHSASFGAHFTPETNLGLTALELTTAGTGVAVIELLLGGHLKSGILKPSDIPMEKLRLYSKSMELVFSTAF